jgi:hypothetical protein
LRWGLVDKDRARAWWKQQTVSHACPGAGRTKDVKDVFEPFVNEDECTFTRPAIWGFFQSPFPYPVAMYPTMPWKNSGESLLKSNTSERFGLGCNRGGNAASRFSTSSAAHSKFVKRAIVASITTDLGTNGFSV